MGPTQINPQRQILSKNVHIIGVNGQTASSYAACLRLTKRFSQTIPIEEMVTHKFKIQEAEAAMKKALSMQSMEVVITPS